MPDAAKRVIERLTLLRDKLQKKAHDIYFAPGGPHVTPEYLDLVDHWGKVRDRLQEIVFLNDGIDFAERAIAEGDPAASHPVQLARLERDKKELAAKLKTVARLENKGNQLLSGQPAPEKKAAAKKQAPPKEPPPEPAAGKKAAPKPGPKPSGPTPEAYVDALAKLKLDAERAVIQQLPALEQQAYNLVVEFVGNLNAKDGKLSPDAQTSAALNTFTDVYTSALTELEDYKGMVSKYLKNFKPIAQLMDEFNASRGLDPAKAQVGAAQEVVIAEVVDRYTENGLNKGFVQPLRELLFNNVAGGLNKKQALTQLEDFIKSGKDSTGKLAQYLEQTAQQGVDSYEGATNTRIMQAYQIDTLIMSGSLIKTSSRQCRYAINELGGLIDRADWPALRELAKDDGLVEGTTFDTLPFNRLHWGCRHLFTPAVLGEKERRTFTKQNPLI